jgi:3'-phosphoadenosine 5'-phosphosulfate sulfotransferase (PAPS reductase)/FAD synthetase
MNPYILSGPTQIGISGGRSSGYMGEKIMEAHDGKLPEDAYMLFNNTGKEAPETLRFLIKLRDKWGVEMPCLEFCGEYPTGLNWRIVRLEDAVMNSEPFDAYLKYYDDFRRLEPDREERDRVPILPNRVNRSCSDRMKIKAAAWYMRSFGYKRWDAIIGIRRDEPSRYRRMLTQNEKGSDRWENQMPMYIDGVTKDQVNAYWKSQPFDLEIDSDFGNCDLCFQKHPNKIYRALMKNPSAADWWIAHEERTGQRFAQNRPSYKVMKWEAIQMLKQVPMFPETEEEEQSADCFCG